MMAVGNWLRRALSRPTPDEPARHATAPEETAPTASVILRGDRVRDDDVLDDYPDALSRSFDKYEWPPSGRDGRQRLSVFGVPNAIVTRCYLSIDPAHPRLFSNQSYEDVGFLWPLGDLQRDDGFVFESNDVETIAGRTVVVGGPIDLNYYHWMLNWLQRLFALAAIAPDIYRDPETRFLIDHRAQREPFASFLRLIGVPDDRIVWSDHLSDYRLEKAVLVSFISQNAYYPDLLRAMVERLRTGMGWLPGVPRRRIFIDRQKLEAPKRRVANMDDISPLLDAFGFERISLEDLTLEDQIRALSEAEVVIGVHGAGLANLIFCPPECTVLLLEKQWSIDIGLARTFATLAKACDLTCDMLTVEGHIVEGTAYDTLFDNHHQDVVVDAEAFAAALRRACPSERVS